jgi:hypothetical protein
MKRRLGETEEQHHLAIVKWAMLHPIVKNYIFHIPNERKCSPHYGMKLKALGVRAGVSDLFIAYPTKDYHGFWIEMKRPGGRPSAEQNAWLEKMRSVGYRAEYYDSWHEAAEAITDYMQY